MERHHSRRTGTPSDLSRRMTGAWPGSTTLVASANFAASLCELCG
jgi:hypothetical protein